MNRAAFGQYFCAGLDSISEFGNAASKTCDLCLDQDLIVVAGGREVAAIGFGNGEECLFFAFEVFVTESAFPAEIGAADFHPDEVVCVIHHPHLIGFGVAYAEAAFGNMRHQDTFKTREGRSRASSCAMKCEAARSDFRE